MKPKTPLIATDAVGFYAHVDEHDELHLYLVRWNRARTARYALAVLRPAGDTPWDARTIRLDYRGQAPLYDLTTDDVYSPATALRVFARYGPYDTCLFCRHQLTDEIPRAFGIGYNCADTHLGLSRRALGIIHGRVDPPPDGGQPTPAPRRGHLHLVAAYGRLLEVA